jgi:hypothetical protein
VQEHPHRRLDFGRLGWRNCNLAHETGHLTPSRDSFDSGVQQKFIVLSPFAEHEQE